MWWAVGGGRWAVLEAGGYQLAARKSSVRQWLCQRSLSECDESRNAGTGLKMF